MGRTTHWQTFVAAVGCLLVFPLIPLLFERMFTGRIAPSSVSLVACNYALAIAFCSRHLFTWMVGMFLGVVFAGIFGFCVGAHAANDVATVGYWPAWFAICMVFLVHAFERYQRHVENKEAFPEFMLQ